MKLKKKYKVTLKSKKYHLFDKIKFIGEKGLTGTRIRDVYVSREYIPQIDTGFMGGGGLQPPSWIKTKKERFIDMCDLQSVERVKIWDVEYIKEKERDRKNRQNEL